MSNATKEDLQKKFTNILNEQKEVIKTIPSLIPNINITKNKLEQFKRYLRIFDYVEKKFSWEKIIKQEPHRKKTKNNENAEENSIRTSKRDLQYAREIIKNVEKCIFPGSYAEKKN